MSLTRSLRKATPGDATAIARVLRESWRSAYAGLVPVEVLSTQSDEQPESWRQFIEGDDAAGRLSWVAEEEGGEIVGFVTVGPCLLHPDLDPRRSAELYAIYLLPRAQGHGLGQELLGTALEALWGIGYREVVLWVLSGNARGRALYTRAGFYDDGMRKLFFDDHAEGCRYRLPLRSDEADTAT